MIGLDYALSVIFITIKDKIMETKEIITPIDKHKVVLKKFITGRDKRELKNVYFKGVQFEIEGTIPKSSKMDMRKLTEEAENRAIELIVISVDGKTENKVDVILDMKGKDYDFVIEEINKITKDNDFLEQSPRPEENTE